MRVHNPGPGEIADRLSILSLKIYYSKDEEAKPALLIEQRELSNLWLSGEYCHISPVSLFQLAHINSLIWAGEDRIRHKRAYYGPDSPKELSNDFTAAAINQQILNDERNALVAEINKKGKSNATKA